MMAPRLVELGDGEGEDGGRVDEGRNEEDTVEDCAGVAMVEEVSAPR
jgi:hypothetical protein